MTRSSRAPAARDARRGHTRRADASRIDGARGGLVLALASAMAAGCEQGGGGAGGAGGGYDPAADPGRVTIHRQNRVEYDNTVRDLLGTTLTPARDFPSDDRGYGFDNIADVLSLSPAQLELYERAATALSTEALAIPVASSLSRLEAEAATGSVGAASGDAWNLWSSGELPITFEFPSNGTYRVAARVWADQAGTELAQLALAVGGQTAGTFDVAATSAAPEVVEVTTTVTAGTKVVSVAFLNDYYDPDAGTDRNLWIDWLEIEGPLDAAGDNPIREALLVCDPSEGEPCVRDIVRAFAERAYRRPLDETELDGLVALVALAESQGDPVDEGLRLAIQAVLTSPHFLFRVELDPDPGSLAPHPLGDFELASRLSYFLWSSMPDAALFDAAREGRLHEPAELEAQVERMLADPKAEALVDNFAGQWLYTRNLADHTPDYQAFPSFDEPLRASMAEETRAFFRAFMQSERPVSEMLTADFTFLDARLAEHYQLSPPGEGGLVEASLAGSGRVGLLMQGSVLTVTSFATRTSPVKRGKWVLTQLLCSPPDDPPPGVEGLVVEPDPTASLRERLEAHRSDPTCAGCHNVMDPLGFGLEHFDGIGAYRTLDQGFPIDASGGLPSGGTFDDGPSMAAALADDGRFPGCVAEKLFTYALGRGLEPSDEPYFEALVSDYQADGESLRALARAIALSEPFRMRRGEAATGGQ
jgi:hypothetical protein